MLVKGKFRVDFTVSELCGKLKTKMSDDLILNYRTEETLMHNSSVAYKDAYNQIKNAIGSYITIEIKHIYFLNQYEES